MAHDIIPLGTVPSRESLLFKDTNDNDYEHHSDRSLPPPGSTVEYGNVPAFIEAGYFAPGTYRDCVIVGERMTLAADFGTSEIRAHTNRHIRVSEGWQAPEGAVETLKATGPEALRRELERFVDAMARRDRVPMAVEAGLLALRTVEAAQRSSALRRRVTLAELA